MQFFAATETWVMKWMAPLLKLSSFRVRIAVLVTSVGVALEFFLLMTCPNLGKIANLFLLVPLVSLILVVLLVRCSLGSSGLVCLGLLCFYALTSWQLTRHWEETRSDVRWMADSRSWKTKVLEQPAHVYTGMKCAIWDGWGMFAQDTDVYLIFDPDDGLRYYSPTHLAGLPSAVWQVQRLEKQWYSVTFYTSEGWDGCVFLH